MTTSPPFCTVVIQDSPSADIVLSDTQWSHVSRRPQGQATVAKLGVGMWASDAEMHCRNGARSAPGDTAPFMERRETVVVAAPPPKKDAVMGASSDEER